MSSQLFAERSVVLRLEFSIADAVRHRGLLRVLAAAVQAWWAQHPANYSDVPPYLRADVGLDPSPDASYWNGIDLNSFKLQPPDRRWP